jgi:signal transduction histidine kinase
VDQTATLRQTLFETQAFAYSVAHDLREPLRAIRALTQATLEDCEPLLGENAEVLKRVTTAAARMNTFLDDLLQLSKSSLQEIKLQSVDLVVLIRELIQERPQWQPPHADLQIIPPTLPIRGERTSLIQCVTNLLSNALKFVQPGTLPRIRIYSQQTTTHTRIFFEDNGIGIPKEDLPHVFKPLYRARTRAHFEGTGLGLAIVQTATARMGGRVGVESEPGKGSRFWLELPTAQAPATNGRNAGLPESFPVGAASVPHTSDWAGSRPSWFKHPDSIILGRGVRQCVLNTHRCSGGPEQRGVGRHVQGSPGTTILNIRGPLDLESSVGNSREIDRDGLL